VISSKFTINKGFEKGEEQHPFWITSPLGEREKYTLWGRKTLDIKMQEG